jgi:hypothetical protein
MISPHPETITKLDAAGRQMNAAIRQFFACGDSVAIHTLTAAAHEILRQLRRAGSSPEITMLWRMQPVGIRGSLVKDSPFILQDRRTEFEKLVSRPQNFFKHAGRDPGEKLDFCAALTEALLMDACMMYQYLTGQHTNEGCIYICWYTLNYPDVVGGGKILGVIQQLRECNVPPNDKSFFLEAIELLDKGMLQAS